MNFSKLETYLDSLSFQELKDILKKTDKNKTPNRYRIIFKKINEKVKKNFEFFKFFIIDYSEEKLKKLLQKTDKEKFPEHFEFIKNRLKQFGYENPEKIPIFELGNEANQFSEDKNKIKEFPKFRIKPAIIFFLASFIVLQLANTFFHFYSTSKAFNIEIYKILSIGFAYVYFAILLFATLYIIRNVENTELSDIGISFRKGFINILRGLLFYLPIGIYFILLKTSGLFYNANNINMDFLMILYQVSMIGIFGPIIEEIVFRGYLINVLRRKFNDNKVVNVYNGLIFGIFHISIISIYSYKNLNLIIAFGLFPFLIGILVSFMYLKYKSIIPAITLHLTHNMLIVLFNIF